MSLVDYDPPDRFVAGTVGPPGQRTFFLQATRGAQRTTASVEKVHVDLVADRIKDLLETTAQVPATSAPADNDPLDTPFEDDFRIASMSLAWDDARNLVVLECHDRDPDADEEEQAKIRAAGLPEQIQGMRVTLAPVAAQEFARRCKALVTAGRPPCPFCGGPLDPEGHICPRANGYKR